MSKKLVVTALGGTIEYATVNEKGGMITGKREDVTQDVLNATQEWFITNDYKMRQIELLDGRKANMFHTTDEEKAERILEILKEGE